MRLYVNLISGEVSVEWPVRLGQARQEVKALTGERVEIRFYQDGKAVLLEEGSALALRVRASKGGTLLAELDGFEVPETAAGGFYSGRLNLNTAAVLAMLDAAPTKEAWTLLAVVEWTIPGADEPEESDDILLAMQRRTGGGGGDPLVLLTPWSWLKERLPEGGGFTHDDDAETIAAVGASSWDEITGKPSTFTPSSHTHAQGEITGLSLALDAKLNANDPSVTNARTPTGGAGGVLSGTYPNPGFAVDMATQAELNAVSGQLPNKADLVDGKVPTSQIPAIAISEFLGPVASQAAMLALNGQKGDWCNRTDTSTAWVVIGDDPTQLASWGQINYPAPLVTSVNGQTGVIVLGKSDVGLGNVPNVNATSRANHTGTQAISTITGLQSALDGKAAASHTHAIADITGLQGALNSKANALLRVMDALIENDTSGTSASSPPDLILQVTQVAGFSSDTTIYLMVNGYQWTIQISLTDPGFEDPWQNQWVSRASGDVNLVAVLIGDAIGYMASQNSIGLGVLVSDDTITVSNPAQGSAAQTSSSISGSGVNGSGGGVGTDATNASGGTLEVALINAVNGTTVKPVKLGFIPGTSPNPPTCPVEFLFRDGQGNEFPLCSALPPDISPRPLPEQYIGAAHLDAWINGVPNATLHARLFEPEYHLNGGHITVWAIAERV